MSDFLSTPMTPARQQRLLGQVYRLLEQQVAGYLRQYHGGVSTSVPAETAQALLESVWYTLDRSGMPLGEGPLEPALERGRQVLEAEADRARQLHRLVCATLPAVSSDFLLSSLGALGRYLDAYDPVHFAHRAPAVPDYPLLRPPEELAGPAFACRLLECMWWENQILAAMDPAAVTAALESAGEDVWGAPVNLCRQPLYNGIARAVLGLPMEDLTVTQGQRRQLLEALAGKPLRPALERGMDAVLAQLQLPDPAAAAYARAALEELEPWLKAALSGGDLRGLFPGAD